MQKFGLEPGPILLGNQSVEGGLATGLKIAKLPDRPTAVIAMNDLTALGLSKAFSRTGLQIPQDMSVVGFDRTFLAEYFTPSLTTIDMHADLPGRLAVDCLHKVSSTAEPQGEEYLIPLQLIVGESTGPAPLYSIKDSLPIESAFGADREQIDSKSCHNILAGW